MHQPSRHAFIATVAGTATAFAGAGTAGAQSLTTVRVAANPVETFMGPYYADELGMFSKAGLAIEFTRAPSGNAALTGIVSGAVDVGASSIVQMANAFLNGVRLVYFAGGAYIDAATAKIAGVCVAKDSPIRTAHDFEGKTMAVLSLRDGSHVMVASYLMRNGVDPAKVNFVEVPFTALASALARGQVAGAFCTEPFMPETIDEMRSIATATDMVGPRFLVAGWVATPKWLSENRDVARRFVSVIYDAARWANDKANTSRRNEILAKVTRMDPNVVPRMVHATYSVTLEPADLDPWLDWAFRLKFIERRVRTADLIDRV